MAGVGIAPVDAIPVDRDVGGGRLRRDQELMRQTLEVVENMRRRIAVGVEEKHLTPILSTAISPRPPLLFILFKSYPRCDRIKAS